MTAPYAMRTARSRVSRTVTVSRRSEPEELLAWQMRVSKIPASKPEHLFATPRKWRFDFAWPDQMLAVECEGGTFTGGRHTRGKGFEEDCEKYNQAVLRGWRVLRFTTNMIESGAAVATIREALS